MYIAVDVNYNGSWDPKLAIFDWIEDALHEHKDTASGVHLVNVEYVVVEKVTQNVVRS